MSCIYRAFPSVRLSRSRCPARHDQHRIIIISTTSAFKQQSSSSLGTRAINRKVLSHSLYLTLSPHPPSLHCSIIHSLSGSGFVSGVSVRVVWRDMRGAGVSCDWCLSFSITHTHKLCFTTTHKVISLPLYQPVFTDILRYFLFNILRKIHKMFLSLQ